MAMAVLFSASCCCALFRGTHTWSTILRPIAHQQTLKENKFKNNSSDESLLNVAVCIELRVEQTNRKWARK